MDYALFQLINNLVGRWWPLDLFGVFCAEYLIFVMAFAVVILFFIWKDSAQKKIHQKVVLKSFAAAALGYIFKIIIQLIYQRPRPFITHDVLQLINNPFDASFPSGHTILAFALAFSVYFYNKKLGSVFLFLAALVGLGRIYVGVHYPLDILGGILVGALSACIVQKIPWEKILKK
jgi:undecaprenyl-diphosphatase